MADHQRNAQSKGAKFYGALVHAGPGAGQLGPVTGPDPGERFFTIRRADFPAPPMVHALSGSFPALTEDKALFPGQPVLAIFGPDYESVELEAARWTVGTAPDSPGQDLGLGDEDVDGLQWGTKPDDLGTLREVKGEYRTLASERILPTPMTCEVWSDGGKVHVEAPTQWPGLVRRTVAHVLDIPEKEVTIHRTPWLPEADEGLLYPAVLAAIAAMASAKSGSPVALRSKVAAATPGVVIKRTTWCSDDGKPVAEEVEMEAETGALPTGGKEFARQALAGLIPNYPLQHFSCSVTVKRSPRAPSAFSGAAGYPQAIASSEAHAARIAAGYELPVTKWKDYVAKGGRRPFTDFMPSVELDSLAPLPAEITKESDFDRKWASGATSVGDFSLLPMTRGIGLATGVSVAGFSTSLGREVDFQAKLTFTEKGNATILTSFAPFGPYASTVRKTVSQYIDLAGERDVILLDGESSGADTGPEILCRPASAFATQLSGACAKLAASLREGAQLPVSHVFPSDERLMPCEFEPRGMASVVVEVSLDERTFVPVATEAWVCVETGAAGDNRVFRDSLKAAVAGELRRLGAELLMTPPRPFKVNLEVRTSGDGPAPGVGQGLRGLVEAAFRSALSQCAPGLGDVLPVTAAMAAEAVAKGGEK